MPGSATDTLEGVVLDWVFGIGSPTRPTAWWIGLATSTPTDASAGTAVSGGGYARVQVSTWTRSVSTINPSADVTFPTATGNWTQATHFQIWSLSSGGTRYFWGSLTANVTVLSGESAKFTAANLAVSLD